MHPPPRRRGRRFYGDDSTAHARRTVVVECLHTSIVSAATPHSRAQNRRLPTDHLLPIYSATSAEPASPVGLHLPTDDSPHRRRAADFSLDPCLHLSTLRPTCQAPLRLFVTPTPFTAPFILYYPVLVPRESFCPTPPSTLSDNVKMAFDGRKRLCMRVRASRPVGGGPGMALACADQSVH